MWRLALRLLLLLPHSGGFLFFSLRRCVSYLELVLSWNIYIISVWLLYRGWISALKRNFPVHKLFRSLCVLFLLFFFSCRWPVWPHDNGQKAEQRKTNCTLSINTISLVWRKWSKKIFVYSIYKARPPIRDGKKGTQWHMIVLYWIRKHRTWTTKISAPTRRNNNIRRVLYTQFIRQVYVCDSNGDNTSDNVFFICDSISLR